MPRKTQPENFMHLVELHERAWGDDSYANRPRLEDILKSRVVALWYPTRPSREDRFFITLHPDSHDINHYITRLVVHSRLELPDKRLYRLFVDQKHYEITGVKLRVVAPEDDVTVVE